MVLRDQMLSVLQSAESGLAALASEAMLHRAYVDAALLLEVARQIQEIGQNTLPALSDTTRPVSTLADSAQSPRSVATSGSLARRSAARRPRKADYPKFFRDGETLIKVGWSKSEGSEYEHKCPKRVLDVLVAELARLAGPGKRFVMDTVLPLRDPDTGAEFSTYQPYIALAFLRQAGLIEQHGRSGYSIPKARTLAADADGAWGGVEGR